MNTPLRFSALVTGLVLSACADRAATFEDFPLEGSAGSSVVGAAGASATAGTGATAGRATAGTGATTGGTSAGATTGGAVSLPEPPIAGSGAQPPSELGGSPAAGSAGAPPIVNPPELLDLIDDAEVGFPALPRRAGRNGAWFSVHDESGGSATPAQALSLVPARGSSHFAAHIKGAGFTGWGTQLGASLKSPVTGYDASAYCGVRFLAKGSGDGWSLLISDRKSSPSGGVCSPDSDDPALRCYDYPGKAFAPSTEWQVFELYFADLAPLQGYADSQRQLDKSALFDIVFNFWNPDGAAFELLIDDLSFMMSCQPQ